MPKLTSTQERVLPKLNSEVTFILVSVALTGEIPRTTKKTGTVVTEMIQAHDLIVHLHDGSWGLRPNGRKLLADINTLMAQAVAQALR